MRRILKGIYYFLPVQLLLLHFRRYQLLLLFWAVLVFTITGKLATHFGASSLFLAPEYLGDISYIGMFLLGSAFCVFIMMWHITTFIIHSKRMSYMWATRHAFLLYSINNSIIPLAFLIFYSVVAVRFQLQEEHTPVKEIILMQLGFYLGLIIVLLISFAYFFRVSRDFFKNTFARIATPAYKMRNVIRRNALEYEVDLVHSTTHLSLGLKITPNENITRMQPRIMKTVLQRHHRNVVFATFIAYVVLLILGVYIDNPYLRIPAGAGFLLLFAIIMGLVGAFKYFMRSWETLGWALFIFILSAMVNYKIFDLRSIAYGLDYHSSLEQVYHYSTLRSLFTTIRYNSDVQTEKYRLDKWKATIATDSVRKPTLVVITTSGGGTRSAYWTFRTLQYIDSVSGGKLFRNTVLLTGASGGMIGATYWRNIHDAHQRGLLSDPYAPRYQNNIGKDLLNPIVFSFASIDMISPFNKITLSGHTYTTDRGYAMEREMARNSEGLLDKPIGYYHRRESRGEIPQLIINGTIVNDGRKLMICNQPIAYLTQPEYSLNLPAPPIDAVDFCAFFPEQNTGELRLTSALRMNATFPYILPVVKLPSHPRMNIMDAGLRDNFGVQVASRYLHVMRHWIKDNVGETIFLEIRDTRENDVSGNTDQTSLLNMVADPLFVIHNKWEAFQSYGYNYVKDFAPAYVDDKLKFITMQYIPREFKKSASLNFHLTRQEKEDIYESIYNPYNQAEVQKLLKLLK
jgi:ABC-type multidrug transport system fused ATPase/permease subunit